MLKKIRSVKKCTGIEALIHDDGSISYRSTTLVTMNDKVRRVGSVYPTKEAHAFGERNIPLSLVISGKGIVVKKLLGSIPADAPVSAVFPQANPEHFYAQISRHQDFTLVAVARKNTVDPLVQEILRAGYEVLDISLGFLAMDSLIPLSRDQIFSFRDTTITVKSHELVKYESGFEVNIDSSDEYLLANQYIQQEHLLSFAAAMRLFIEDINQLPAIQDAEITGMRKNFIYKSYFRTAVMAFSGVLFVALLTNFLLFNYYFKENRNLSLSQGISRENEQKQKSLAEAISSKEQFLENAGWHSQEKSSFFADRFAAFLPDDIWLTSLHFYPLNNGVFSQKNTASFKNDTISLSALCQDAGRVTVFMNNLKTMTQVKEVTMKNYTYHKEENNGEFLLEIITK